MQASGRTSAFPAPCGAGGPKTGLEEASEHGLREHRLLRASIVWEENKSGREPQSDVGSGLAPGKPRFRAGTAAGVAARGSGSRLRAPASPCHTPTAAEDPRSLTPDTRCPPSTATAFVQFCVSPFVPPLTVHVLHTCAWHAIFLWNLING